MAEPPHVYPGHHSVTASVTVSNAADAIDFYKQVFDATEPYERTGSGPT